MSRVLITKNITPNQLRLIVDAELEFEIETAIKFEIDYKTYEVIQTIKERSDWLFTSINAVRSIQPLLVKYQNKFEQKIYCVGKGTYNLLSQLGYYSVTAYENEAELKEKFDWAQAGHLTYFCNSNKKKLLPEGKVNEQLLVKFVEVFKTSLLHPTINSDDFDYVLYFSPTGVKSILDKNPQLKSVNSICSGPATLKLLKEYGVENCYLPEQPQLKTMIEFILKHQD